MNWHIWIQVQLGELILDVDLGGGDTPLALIGPNGAGKTTLLRAVAGAHRPTVGAIRIGEDTLMDTTKSIHLPPEAREVAYLPQGHGLFPHLSVLDNVTFGLLARGVGREASRDKAQAMLEVLGCGKLAPRMPRGLSGGERQQIALARALVVEPRMLLFDEPLSALDAAARRATRTLLAAHLQQLGRPSIIVTHDCRDVMALAGRVAVLEQGRIVQQGPPEELRTEPATEFVAEFFGT